METIPQSSDIDERYTALQPNDKNQVQCPECGQLVGLGPGGIKNFTLRHIPSEACQNRRQQYALEKTLPKKKKPKQASLGSFFAKSTSEASASRARGFIPPNIPPPPTLHARPVQESVSVSKPAIEDTRQTRRPETPLLAALFDITSSLPPTIPGATSTTFLVEFDVDPTMYDDSQQPIAQVYEDQLNPMLHTALGYNETFSDRVLGLEASRAMRMVEFLRYFVEERGLEPSLIENRIQRVLDALKPYGHHIPEPVIEVIEISGDESSTERGVDAPGPGLRKETHRCRGYRVPIPDGLSPWAAYPFYLHEKPGLPWDLHVNAGVTRIFAVPGCAGNVAVEGGVCRACRALEGNDRLLKMLDRMKEGVKPGTNWTYMSMEQLHALLKHKNEQIKNYRLHGLNQARKLTTVATALSDYKRLVMAVASQKINRIQTLLQLGVAAATRDQAHGQRVLDAAGGVYKPKSYEEEDYMQGLLLWKLGGDRIASIAHRALGLPAVSTLCNQSRVPPIVVSPWAPTVEEVTKNTQAGFSDVKNHLQPSTTYKVHHAVIKFDEIATERQIRYNAETNLFMGVCREHAHLTTLEFGSQRDLEELFRSIDKGEVHCAGEATVGALGLLSDGPHLQAPRIILVSADCKQESGEEHYTLLSTTLTAVNKVGPELNVRAVSITSDGEFRRALAMVMLVFKKLLSPSSPIYPLLSSLKFMDFHVGDDDLTGDKDHKHLFKRDRNALLSPRGVTVNNICITVDILRSHFTAEGVPQDHINAILNPADKQDVKLAYDLLKAIWTLPRVPSSPSPNPGTTAAREALWILGRYFYHTVYPFITINLSLADQLAHLSAAAHLGMILYRAHGTKFLNSSLYFDTMLMIKNVFFCVAKAKVNNPDSEFWIVLLGTDRLEEVFGIVRTMIGNDANVDIQQLASRLRSCTEIANILMKYPHWDRPPRRLKMPVLLQDDSSEAKLDGKVDSEPTSSETDHIKPHHWSGDVRVRNVSLQTAWKEGRRMVEEEVPSLRAPFQDLDRLNNPHITILSPNGQLLINLPPETPSPNGPEDQALDEDGSEDEGSEDESVGSAAVEVEEELARIAAVTTEEPLEHQSKVERTVNIDGKIYQKSRALAMYSRYHKTPSSTDRLRRVQHLARYNPGLGDPSFPSTTRSLNTDEPPTSLVIHDPFATLVSCEGKVWLAIGEVNSIRIDGQSTTAVLLDLLMEEVVSVSFQLVGLRSATITDDETGSYDWRSRSERTLSGLMRVPGRLVEPVNPFISQPPLTSTSPTKPTRPTPFYLFDTASLLAVASLLVTRLRHSDLKSLPKISFSETFPYRESISQKLCFVCETGDDSSSTQDPTLDDNGAVCRYCPNAAIDGSQGQRILEHMAAHILFDSKLPSDIEHCGMCLRPISQCQVFLLKVRGSKPLSFKIDQARSSCRRLQEVKFSYAVAATSTPSSPCTNVPVYCPLCPKERSAVWKYNMKIHFSNHHKTSMNISEYAVLWDIPPEERCALKEIWNARALVPSRRTKKGDMVLNISEVHSHSLSSSLADVATLPAEGQSTQGNTAKALTAATPSQPEDDAPSSVERVADIITDNSNAASGDEPGPERATNDDDPEDDVGATIGPSGIPPTPNELLGRGHRQKRKTTETELGRCSCGLRVDDDASDLVRCSFSGCETYNYHLGCVGFEKFAPIGWVCSSCKPSSGKRSRKH